MPPWSLHHLIIPRTASPISWSRPGAPENPRSSPYAMWIAAFVTPCSVAPLGLPRPHGEAHVPNVAPAGAVVEDEPPFEDVTDDDAPADAELDDEPRPPLQATATSASTERAANPCDHRPR